MDIVSLIDTGAFAYVFKAKTQKGDFYAIKAIDVSCHNSSILEIDIFVRMNHPHLLHMFSMIPENGSYKIGFQLPLSDSTLTDVMHKFTWEDVMFVIGNVSDGLAFLHQNNIAHLDIKTDNILCFGTEPGKIRAKITDFGASMIIFPGEIIVSDVCRITFPHRPPEVYSSSKMYQYSIGNDVWSMGILFLIVINGKIPFDIDKGEKYVLSKNYKEGYLVKLSDKIIGTNKPICKLIKKMLLFDPKKRPTMPGVLKEIGFKGGPGVVIQPETDIEIPPWFEDYKLLVDIFMDLGEKINTPLETFFIYMDLFFRSIGFFNKTDDPSLYMIAFLAIAHNLSVGESVIPVENENRKAYIKYETYIIFKLGGILYNDSLPKYTYNVVESLKLAMVPSTLYKIPPGKPGAGTINLRKKRYKTDQCDALFKMLLLYLPSLTS